MLVVYTPNEQTEEVIKQVESTAWRNSCIKQPQQVGGKYSVIFEGTWCRELACSMLFDSINLLPPGKLNIYGIRKHGTSWSHQPTDCIGEIHHPDRYLNILFTNLFQIMTKMFSSILGTEQLHQLYTPRVMINRISHNQQIAPLHSTLQAAIQAGQPKWLLNIDEEVLPSQLLEETRGLYGTIYNIPSEWAKYPAVMSYLLYLPRVWGGFYEKTGMLSGLSKLGRLKYNEEFLAGICAEKIETTGDHREGPLALWLQLARRLMLPMWFTQYGSSQFWIFTYMVIREGMAVRWDRPRIPGFQTALGAIGCSGFMSWFRKYKCQPEHDAPTWVSDLFALLQDQGPFSILKSRTIAKHI